MIKSKSAVSKETNLSSSEWKVSVLIDRGKEKLSSPIEQLEMETMRKHTAKQNEAIALDPRL